MRVTVYNVADQKAALRELGKLIEGDTVDPLVRNAALAITGRGVFQADDHDGAFGSFYGGADCASKDDECEVTAIFEAIRSGTDQVEGLDRGLKYMSDPRWADFFSSPSRILKQCAIGHNEGDCDDFSSLFCGLLGSLGYVTGLRAWGRTRGEYVHVYPVVGLPKIGWRELIALDATVEGSEPGWEPPGGHTLTKLLVGFDDSEDGLETVPKPTVHGWRNR